MLTATDNMDEPGHVTFHENSWAQRPHIACFHLYEGSRKDKFREIENKSVVS